MQAKAFSYSAVTPVRDEAANLRRLADCLAAQTTLPRAWVIVDNGSADGTLNIAQELARDHAWVHALSIEGGPKLARGAPVVRAFHHGLAPAEGSDVVVKLDADVSFGSDYFELLLAEFAANAGLGIASGVCYEQVDGRWTAQHVARSHVRGATRAYRDECLRQILPLEERMGWDGIDELKANVRGWQTTSFSHIAFYHHRKLGERDGAWRAWTAQGETAHYMGYRLSYVLLRSVFRMTREPAAAAMIGGYVAAWVRRMPVFADREARRHLRDQQRLRAVPRRIREVLGRG